MTCGGATCYFWLHGRCMWCEFVLGGSVGCIGFDDDDCLELVSELVIVIGESILGVFFVDLFLCFVRLLMIALLLYF